MALSQDRLVDPTPVFRNDASITKLGRAPVDVTLLIEKLMRLLRPPAESQQVKIQIDLPRELVGLIQADSLDTAANAEDALTKSPRFSPKSQVDLLRVLKTGQFTRVCGEEAPSSGA